MNDETYKRGLHNVRHYSPGNNCSILRRSKASVHLSAPTIKTDAHASEAILPRKVEVRSDKTHVNPYSASGVRHSRSVHTIHNETPATRMPGEPISYKEAKRLFVMKDSKALFETARFVARQNEGNKISFYKNAFPPISVTGTECSLNCHHCGRHYLRHMAPATTNERLVEHCLRLHGQGVPGIVLSGGSGPDGVVPLHEFAEGIREVKERTDLAILAHTGPINDRQANVLGRAGLDGTLLDVIGSADTAEKVCGVRISPKRYAKTIAAIDKSEMKLSPHIIVGLDYGRVNGELKALELLRSANVDNICIIVLIPTRNTPMECVLPPSPDTVGRIVAIAKLMYLDVPVSLGCVRPGKTYRQAIDAAAIRAGATRIAIPSREAKRVAEELGFEIKEFELMCCGFHKEW